jgi:hypothetical protein
MEAKGVSRKAAKHAKEIFKVLVFNPSDLLFFASLAPLRENFLPFYVELDS